MKRRCLLIFVICIGCCGMAAADTLVVNAIPCGIATREKIVNDFMLTYAEMNVEFTRTPNEGELTTALINQDPTVDIYCVSTAYGALKNIRDKHLFVDLSGIEGVRSKVEDLYPQFEALFVKEKEICAFPMFIIFNQVFLWNKSVAADMGLTAEDVPTTYLELLDRVDWWENSQNKEGMSNYAIYSSGDAANLYAMTAFELYKAVSLKETGTIRYHDPRFLQALHRVDQYTQVMPYTSDAESNAISSSVPTQLLVHASSEVPANTLLNGGQMIPIAIAFDDHAQPVVSVSFICYFINPYSAHVEEAKEMLACIARNQSVHNAAAMMPGLQAPVENPHYEKGLEAIEKKISSLQAGTEGAISEQYYDNKAALAKLEKQKEEWIAHQAYLISPEVLQNYQNNVVPYFYLCGNSIYETRQVDQTISETYYQYMKGLIDTQTLTQKLDRVIEMVTLENK